MKRLRSYLLVLVFLFSLFAASAAPALAQSCSTPAPTYTPTPGYRATVQAVDAADLLVYFPMDETGGTTLRDDSGHGADGSYNGPTLNATTFLTGDPAPGFDGINDYGNIYTSYLASNFNSAEGTMLIWSKTDASYWIDNTQRFLMRLFTDTNNEIRIYKLTNNSTQYRYLAGGTLVSYSGTTTPTAWTQRVITWSHSGDVITAYRDGLLQATRTSLGTWSGGLSTSNNVIGASSNAGASPHLGNLAQAAIWKAPLNATQVALLATVPAVLTIPPTPTLCPTDTPTPTYTPTITPSWTPSPTPTITPTANLYVDWTQPPPDSTGTPQPGQPVRFGYTMSAGQTAIAVVLGMILFSLFAMAIIWLWTRRS